MFKQDYIALAKIIKDNTKVIRDYLTTVNGEPKITGIILIKRKFLDDLCQYLKSDNPRFDEETFRKACE
jgi:hypothetical protein